ncbi:hypothetical protein ACJJTC_014417 [Scirpophaga incertulas]
MIAPNQDSAFNIEYWNCSEIGHAARYCPKNVQNTQYNKFQSAAPVRGGKVKGRGRMQVRPGETQAENCQRITEPEQNNEYRQNVIVDNMDVDRGCIDREEIFEDCIEEIINERNDIVNEPEKKSRSRRIVKPPKRLEDYETYVSYSLCMGDPVCRKILYYPVIKKP